MNSNDSLTTTKVSKSYLVITNISKRANVRALLQVGVAFGCTKFLIVGQKSFSFDITIHNDENTDTTSTDVPKYLLPVFASGEITIERFSKWNDCFAYIKEQNILLVGVEIHKDAKTIQEICHHLGTIKGGTDVAFLMGNEGTGIQDKQMKDCSLFCRIPQYGTGTASLNVYVAASIVLYQFHIYQQRNVQHIDRSYETNESRIDLT
jgi:tRNA(Leu) C34 or U34 (ribose-2'-O)-methylase TrmL